MWYVCGGNRDLLYARQEQVLFSQDGGSEASSLARRVMLLSKAKAVMKAAFSSKRV